MEFETKQEKAQHYAENWDQLNPNVNHKETFETEISAIDYLAGYNQALEDLKVELSECADCLQPASKKELKQFNGVCRDCVPDL